MYQLDEIVALYKQRKQYEVQVHHTHYQKELQSKKSIAHHSTGFVVKALIIF